MKNKFFAISAFCLFFMISSCGSNSNIFSWAHDKGSGDFSALKADGNAAMKENKYRDAAKYYESALKKNPNDAECALGYTTAKLFDVIESQYGDIVNTFISDGGTSSEKLLGFITGDTPQKIVEALEKAMGTSDGNNGYLTNAANNPNASTDVLINAAAANIILGVAEVLSNTAPYVEQYLNLNSDFSVNVITPTNPQERQELLRIVENLLDRADTSVRYLNNAPINNLAPNVDQSQIMNTITNSLSKFKAELSNAKQTLS